LVVRVVGLGAEVSSVLQKKAEEAVDDAT